ncbi:MAG: Uma2 family endonuclease [Anaerolineae bacterium]|nr:Uma2 family endonuclease [Anaerolineae bacterium]
MVTPVQTKTTFAEYDALPETNQIVELIDGEIVMNPPVDPHQVVVGNIYFHLRGRIATGQWRLAPTGLHFDDDNSFEPDIFWVSTENTICALEPDGRYWHGAPDLVIEVLSPSTAYRDRGIKYETYQRYGVREYWLVDADGRYAEVYVLLDGKFQRQGVFSPGQPFVSAVLGGVSIDVTPWFTD